MDVLRCTWMAEYVMVLTSLRHSHLEHERCLLVDQHYGVLYVGHVSVKELLGAYYITDNYCVLLFAFALEIYHQDAPLI